MGKRENAVMRQWTASPVPCPGRLRMDMIREICYPGRCPTMTKRNVTMADQVVPHFQNTSGHDSIAIGTRKFMCIGAKPPFDHPHVFLDMGTENEIVCPYCSTLYKFDPTLEAEESSPNDCVWTPEAA